MLAQQELAQAARDATSRRWKMTTVTVTAGLVAMCVAAALSAVAPSRAVIPGLPDAGTLTALSLPAVRGLFNLAAAATIGWLLGASVLAPPQASGVVDVAGYRALRAASLSAIVWAAAGFALVPLTLSDTQGRALSESLSPQALMTAFSVLANMRAPFIAACVAVVLAIAARSVLRVSWVFVLLALAFAALIPVALAGHATQSADHDIAVNSLFYHLFGSAVWVGGLIALVGLAKQGVRRLDVVARRYSTIAAVTFVAVGASGVINAFVRVPFASDLWQTDYGRLIVLKTLLILALGGLGYLHRKATIPKIGRTGGTGPFIRLAVVEIFVMAATLGVAATLVRTATPPPAGLAWTDAQIVLGYDLPGSPTIANLATVWRFDLILGTAAVLAAVLYVIGVMRLRRRGDAWSPWRTTAWLLGCATLLVSSSSGLGAYGHGQFSVHMVSHMMLAMLVPIFMVLGGAITLLLRVLPPTGPDDPPGLRELVVGFVHSPFSRALTHPLVVLALFVGSFYALYLTDLFGMMISSHFGHLFMNVHFVLTGYLYYWVVIGVDPAPRQLNYPIKIGLLFAAMPFHAFAGLALMSSHQLLATDFYHRLALPWVDDLLADQQLGGGIGWGFTEIPVAIVAIALVAQWARSEDRLSRRSDRREEATDNAELEAYNAMLAKWAELDAAERR